MTRATDLLRVSGSPSGSAYIANVPLSENAKTTADVRGGLRASPRGPSWPPSPRRPRRGAHVPGAHDEADTREDGSCARASSGVFAGTEQHVGQFSDGMPATNERVRVTDCPGDAQKCMLSHDFGGDVGAARRAGIDDHGKIPHI